MIRKKKMSLASIVPSNWDSRFKSRQRVKRGTVKHARTWLQSWFSFSFSCEMLRNKLNRPLRCSFIGFFSSTLSSVKSRRSLISKPTYKEIFEPPCPNDTHTSFIGLRIWLPLFSFLHQIHSIDHLTCHLSPSYFRSSTLPFTKRRSKPSIWPLNPESQWNHLNHLEHMHLKSSS